MSHESTDAPSCPVTPLCCKLKKYFSKFKSSLVELCVSMRYPWKKTVRNFAALHSSFCRIFYHFYRRQTTSPIPSISKTTRSPAHTSSARSRHAVQHNSPILRHATVGLAAFILLPITITSICTSNNTPRLLQLAQAHHNLVPYDFHPKIHRQPLVYLTFRHPWTPTLSPALKKIPAKFAKFTKYKFPIETLYSIIIPNSPS